MPTPRALILRAPGTNCDLETEFAFQTAGARAERLHINRVLEGGACLDHFQILCLPGGFSYGDDIAAGRILANQLQLRLKDEIEKFVAAGKLILGICNGFQILLKSGFLLAENGETCPPATLTWNDTGQFEDRWVHLKTAGSKSVFLRGIETMYLPVAHAEGKFVARCPDTLAALQSNGQLPLRYACKANAPSENGNLDFPDNPNGSQGNVAGVCDASGRILGLMPHPERYIERTQHPRWTRENLSPEGDGMAVFRNAVQYFE